MPLLSITNKHLITPPTVKQAPIFRADPHSTLPLHDRKLWNYHHRHAIAFGRAYLCLMQFEDSTHGKRAPGLHNKLKKDLQQWCNFPPEQREIVRQVLRHLSAQTEKRNIQLLFDDDASDLEKSDNLDDYYRGIHLHRGGDIDENLLYYELRHSLDRELRELRNIVDLQVSNPNVHVEKLNWASNRANKKRYTAAEQLIITILTEDIFTTTIKTIISWLAKNEQMPAFCSIYMSVSSDEDRHRNFAIDLHKRLGRPAPPATILQLTKQAVNLEKKFLHKVIATSEIYDIIQIRLHVIRDLIEHRADRLLIDLGQPAYYSKEKKNPLPWFDACNQTNETYKKIEEIIGKTAILSEVPSLKSNPALLATYEQSKKDIESALNNAEL